MTTARARTALRLAAVAAALAPAAARAAPPREGILELHADATVRDDGSVAVDETILVWVAGARIVDGITRDIPTRYRDGAGGEHVLGIEGLKVTRDGQREDCDAAPAAGGARLHLRLGRPGAALTPGTHVYVVSYETRRQLGFHADRDELEWHVTGEVRDMAIEQMAAVVHLPVAAARALGRASAFTGAHARQALVGRRGLDVVATVTWPLPPGEGLTVVVAWPKGHVRPPGIGDRIAAAATVAGGGGDGRFIALALTALVAELGVWLAARRAAGPGAGSAAAAQPPAGLSAAALGFVARRGVDPPVLAAALLGAAGKGHLVVEVDGAGVAVGRGAGEAPLAPEERAAVEALLADGDRIRVGRESAAAVAAAGAALAEALADDVGDRYWTRTGSYVALGLGCAALALVGVIAGAHGAGARAASALLAVALALGAAILAGVVAANAKLWTRAGRRRYHGRFAAKAAAGALVAAALIAALGAGLPALAALTSWAAALAVVVAGALARQLVRAIHVATPDGRALSRDIAAYRAWLVRGGAGPRGHAVALGAAGSVTDAALVDALVAALS